MKESSIKSRGMGNKTSERVAARKRRAQGVVVVVDVTLLLVVVAGGVAIVVVVGGGTFGTALLFGCLAVATTGAWFPVVPAAVFLGLLIRGGCPCE